MTPADPIHSADRAMAAKRRCWWASPECCWPSSAFLLDREQFLRSYLFAYLYWTGMALGCLAILLLHHVVGGKWGMVIRRMCEAGARTLPYMVVLLIPVLLGMPTLYPWARPEALHDANIQSKAAYLNIPVLHRPRRILLRHLVLVRVSAEQVVGRAGSHRRRTADRQDARRQRVRAGGLHVHHDLRLHRLDHVAGAALVLDHLRRDVPDRPDAGVVRVRDRAGDRAFEDVRRSRNT